MEDGEGAPWAPRSEGMDRQGKSFSHLLPAGTAIQLQIELVTPAFLGDAQQKGAWRTPPFKALLRQWWRLVVAPSCAFDPGRLLEREGELFGHAGLKHQGKPWALRSRLLVRFTEPWRAGSLTTWPADPTVWHPEVGNSGKPVGAHLYLGYGPLEWDKNQGATALNSRRSVALKDGEKMGLQLSVPQAHAHEVIQALQLVAWLGTVGGRSRNGWGSLIVSAENLKDLKGVEALLDARAPHELRALSRPWQECLKRDWPHALGQDERGLLLWRTRSPFPSWEQAMKALAEVKIRFRGGVSIGRNRGHHNPILDDRHLLAYPVTNHHVRGWGAERLPNQLRFRVLRHNGRYWGCAYHLPCALPQPLVDKANGSDPHRVRARQLQIWGQVHRALDQSMQRVP